MNHNYKTDQNNQQRENTELNTMSQTDVQRTVTESSSHVSIGKEKQNTDEYTSESTSFTSISDQKETESTIISNTSSEMSSKNSTETSTGPGKKDEQEEMRNEGKYLKIVQFLFSSFPNYKQTSDSAIM